MVIIDGITYDVPFVSCKRTADLLDKYAKRTEDGGLKRKLIGVYYDYEIKFGRMLDGEKYEAFFNKLTEPVEYHTVTVPGSNGNYSYTAYFSSVSDNLKKQIDGKNYWTGLTAKFTAKSPARVP